MPFLCSREHQGVQQGSFEFHGDICRIGRSAECGVHLNYNGISRIHACITCENDNHYIEDLKSRNGTFLHGKPIEGKTQLRNGDVIQFCDIEFIFYINAPSRGVSVTEKPRVIIDETEDPRTFSISSEIVLGDKKTSLTSANAAVKLQAMIDIGRKLGAAADQVLPQLVQNLLKIFLQADCAAILLINEQSRRLELRAFEHRDLRNNEEHRISRSVLDKVVHSKAAIISDDVANDSRFDMSESIVNYRICSIMATPIMDYDQSEVLGVIQVDARTSGRKFTFEDLDLLVALSYQVAVSYQNAKLQELAIAEEVMEREMNIANTVQRGLLPIAPPSIPNYEFYDFYKPAKYLGGDYYDYIPLPDGRLVFALGDVSGKGVSAALLMAKLSAEVRSGLLIEKTFKGTVERVNRLFCEPRWDNRFITFFFGVLNPETHEIVFHNAGHVPPMLVTNGTVEILGEENISLPLGIMDDSEYPETRFTIEKGQKLVIISDGITDAMNSQGKYFTSAGVFNFLRESKTESVVEFGKNLISAVYSFAGREPQFDDQTLVILGRHKE